jgi:tRNA pseudouridine55 synthase
VVARVRRLAGQKRVGHAGTLDPLAEGVLVVLLGRATRLADLVQSGQKTYVASIQLGVRTDTDDAEGSIIATARVPALHGSLLQDTLGRFTGDILQTPPHYSAVKVAGRRAYALARGGAAVDLSPRQVTIDCLRLLDLTATSLRLEVTCSKGTYIRALARDLALALGTVGYLASLLRTRVGPFTLADSLTLDELAARGIVSALLPASRALPTAPSFAASSDAAQRLAHGQAIQVRGLRGEHVWVYDPEGQLMGLASADGMVLKPRLAL